MQKPIIFRVDRDLAMDKLEEEELLKDHTVSSDEMADKKITSPWLHSFDALKTTMSLIPGNTEIYKRIINEGSGDVLGRRKCRIKWTYSIFLESEEYSFDSSYTNGTGVNTIESDEVIAGLWYSLETMRKGEESHFIIGYKLMYGELGDMSGETKIKPKADVLLVAKLVDFEEIGSENACEKLTEEELHQYSTVKAKAIEMQKNLNDLYGQGRYAQAISRSLEIIQRLRFCEIQHDEEQKDRNQFLADVYVKLIDCNVKKERYEKACEAIQELRHLTNVDNLVDVLVNEAIARSKTEDSYENSIELMRKAQSRHPRNELVNNTLNDLQAARDKYKNETKSFMMKAFQQKPQKPAAQKVSAQEEQSDSELVKIIKSFDKIDIGTGIPLVGYTPDELEMVQEAVKKTPYKVQAIRNHDGKLGYFIKRDT